jgi:hypothetical protein
MHFKQIGVIVFAQGYTVPVGGSKSFPIFFQYTWTYFQPKLSGGNFTIRRQGIS